MITYIMLSLPSSKHSSILSCNPLHDLSLNPLHSVSSSGVSGHSSHDVYEFLDIRSEDFLLAIVMLKEEGCPYCESSELISGSGLTRIICKASHLECCQHIAHTSCRNLGKLLLSPPNLLLEIPHPVMSTLGLATDYPHFLSYNSTSNRCNHDGVVNFCLQFQHIVSNRILMVVSGFVDPGACPSSGNVIELSCSPKAGSQTFLPASRCRVVARIQSNRPKLDFVNDFAFDSSCIFPPSSEASHILNYLLLGTWNNSRTFHKLVVTLRPKLVDSQSGFDVLGVSYFLPVEDYGNQDLLLNVETTPRATTRNQAPNPGLIMQKSGKGEDILGDSYSLSDLYRGGLPFPVQNMPNQRPLGAFKAGGIPPFPMLPQFVRQVPLPVAYPLSSYFDDGTGRSRPRERHFLTSSRPHPLLDTHGGGGFGRLDVIKCTFTTWIIYVTFVICLCGDVVNLWFI
jgi:hypothetical protein